MEMMDVDAAIRWLNRSIVSLETARTHLQPFSEVDPFFHRDLAAQREVLREEVIWISKSTTEIVDLIELDPCLAGHESLTALITAVRRCLGEVHKTRERLKEVIAVDYEVSIRLSPKDDEADTEERNIRLDLNLVRQFLKDSEKYAADNVTAPKQTV